MTMHLVADGNKPTRNSCKNKTFPTDEMELKMLVKEHKRFILIFSGLFSACEKAEFVILNFIPVFFCIHLQNDVLQFQPTVFLKRLETHDEMNEMANCIKWNHVSFYLFKISKIG